MDFREPSIFKGTGDDIRREQRMNNWIRAQSLASPLRADVERAMLDNPYDFNAGLRMEDAVDKSNAVIAPWQVKEKYAQSLFADEENSPFRVSGSRYAPTPHAAVASTGSPPSPRAATQSAGPVAMPGSFEGRSGRFSGMVPTAGNYQNGAFNQYAAELGVSPQDTQNAYREAVYNYRTPGQRHDKEVAELYSGAKVEAAEAAAQGRVISALAGGDAKVEAALIAALGRGQAGDSARAAKIAKEALAQESELRSVYSKYEAKAIADGVDPVGFRSWKLSDPTAQNIMAKYKARGSILNGGEQAPPGAADKIYDTGGLPAAPAQPAAAPAQQLARPATPVVPATRPSRQEMMKAVEEKVADMQEKQKMSDAQILAYARKHGAEAEVAEILANRRLLKVRHGAPVPGKAKPVDETSWRLPKFSVPRPEAPAQYPARSPLA